MSGRELFKSLKFFFTLFIASIVTLFFVWEPRLNDFVTGSQNVSIRLRTSLSVGIRVLGV